MKGKENNVFEANRANDICCVSEVEENRMFWYSRNWADSIDSSLLYSKVCATPSIFEYIISTTGQKK